MDQLHCMRVFVRVVEHGAFVRAADDLAISRASVTTAVSQLERQLGVRLLNRTTRRLSLTEEGRAYYHDCVRILGQIDESQEHIADAQRSPSGRLRLSIAQSFEAMSFFPLLNEFMRLHPGLSVEVIVTDRAVNLVEEGIDCAMRGTEIPADALLVARKVMKSRWLTCASPSYLAKHGTPGSVNELEEHNCVRFISPSTGRSREWFFNQHGRITRHVPTGNLALTSLDAAAAAALAGIGIVQVPDVLVCHLVMERRLKPLLSELVAKSLPVMLVYPRNRYLPARVRAFIDFIDRAYPKEGWWTKIETVINADDDCALQERSG